MAARWLRWGTCPGSVAFYQCLTVRADGLFELADVVLCADGPVTSLVELSLEPEHRRGHGSLYDSLNQGRIDIGRFRNVMARQSIPRGDGGRIVLGIDVSHWLRPDANASPERLFCHTYARGKGQAQMIPGWPYSFVAALETGRTSWTRRAGRDPAGPRRRRHRGDRRPAPRRLHPAPAGWPVEAW